MIKKAKPITVIYLVAFIEIAIGFCTIGGLALSSIFSLSQKPPNIFMFVFISAVISTSLGIGLLLAKNWARKLLMFFSGWVILTKLLIFMGVLQFSGELLTVVSNPAKNTLSIVYHATLIILLNHQAFKKYFFAKKP
ncbi:MAG: hypothetical protein ISS92_05175 [Candidatus Omnitrophica bacterium]|nr:hypothetical protein [Candidatus Omnitrophota bacterium]